MSKDIPEVYIEPQPPSFKNFYPYVTTDSLPREFVCEFISILLKLHEKTGHLWKPGGCGKATTITTVISTLIPNDIQTNTMLYLKEHSWTQLSIQKMKIIVDPFGVYEPTQHSIIPYFGNLEEIKQPHPSAYNLYSMGKPLTPEQESIFFLMS